MKTLKLVSNLGILAMLAGCTVSKFQSELLSPHLLFDRVPTAISYARQESNWPSTPRRYQMQSEKLAYYEYISNTQTDFRDNYRRSIHISKKGKIVGN